jgi:hypothetical protein
MRQNESRLDRRNRHQIRGLVLPRQQAMSRWTTDSPPDQYLARPLEAAPVDKLG